MELYSVHGSEPRVIYMLEFPDGSTRTGDDYTEEECERAGVTGPYTRPEYDEYFQQLNWDSENLRYVVSNYSDEEYMQKVREHRNYLLRDTDVVMVEDYPAESNIKNKYKEFRSMLRNIPQNIEKGELNIPRNREDFANLFSFSFDVGTGTADVETTDVETTDVETTSSK